MITFSAFSPSCTRLTLTRLLMNRPAATSSVIDRAICAVASVVRNLEAPRAPEGWPAVPFSAETRSARVLCRAGKRPNSSPVASVRAAAKIITGTSTCAATVLVASFGSIASIRSSVHCATTRPAAPPSSESRHDSPSSWRTSRARPAPIESRTAISPARAADRASSRLAMFAHAMTSTNAVTHCSRISGVRASALTLLWPAAPGSRTSVRALKRAIVCGLMPCCSGASTSLMML